MRNRTSWFLGIALFCILAIAGTGFVMAATHGGLGTGATTQGTTPQSKTAFGVTHVYIHDNPTGGDEFVPAQIQVVLGTTVTWTNQGTDVDNVTIIPVVVTSSNNWTSGLLYPGRSFSYTFPSRGTFHYYCQLHHGMTGTVIVT